MDETIVARRTLVFDRNSQTLRDEIENTFVVQACHAGRSEETVGGGRPNQLPVTPWRYRPKLSEKDAHIDEQSSREVGVRLPMRGHAIFKILLELGTSRVVETAPRLWEPAR